MASLADWLSKLSFRLFDQQFITFSDVTEVYFKNLNNEEIYYYIDKFQPYDKAGGYGIQEWIGMVGISKIVGSFYNVMVYQLKRFMITSLICSVIRVILIISLIYSNFYFHKVLVIASPKSIVAPG